MSEIKKVKIETYTPDEDMKPKYKQELSSLTKFGIEQNKFNKIIVNRIRRVENENRNLKLEMWKMRDDYEERISSLEEYAHLVQGQLESMGKMIDRLRLSEKLNSNSIDRLTKANEDNENKEEE